ncbi:MAG: methyltransferase domain-containing protein [Verrucomicrobia bacterium]|nr:methyltransferase domain-containing protein [Verrucomicrobiota bacterium]
MRLLNSFLRSLHEPVYARRLAVLSDLVVQELRSGDRVLDVGCGSGRLGQALLRHPDRPESLIVHGMETQRRPDCAVPVTIYDGASLPFEEGAFDVVIVADVLHHASDPNHLLEECCRVSRRLVLVKDHKIDGWLAQWRLCLLDWAANAPYDVPCRYRYATLAEWREVFESLPVHVKSELVSMRLYPAGWNWFFGRRLQYFAVLEVL